MRQNMRIKFTFVPKWAIRVATHLGIGLTELNERLTESDRIMLERSQTFIRMTLQHHSMLVDGEDDIGFDIGGYQTSDFKESFFFGMGKPYDEKTMKSIDIVKHLAIHDITSDGRLFLTFEETVQGSVKDFMRKVLNSYATYCGETEAFASTLFVRYCSQAEPEPVV